LGCVLVMGVKSFARKLLLCPYFKPNQNVLGEAKVRHEAFKDQIRKLLESRGVKCRDEVEIELPVSRRKGKIDLLCEGDSRVIVVEVKSSRVTDLSLQDFLQLTLYAYAYSKGNEGVYMSLELVLAYKGPRDMPVLLKVTEDLKNALGDIARSLDERLTGGRESLDPSKPRVLSPLCKLCISDGCFFKQMT